MISQATTLTAFAEGELLSHSPEQRPWFIHDIFDSLPEDVSELEDYQILLCEVHDGALELLNGRKRPTILAGDMGDAVSFGMASFLSHVVSTQLTPKGVSIRQIINMIYSEDLRHYRRKPDPKLLSTKRIRMINRMINLNLISEKASPRDLRPVGSIPKFRMLSEMISKENKNITLATIRSDIRNRETVFARFELIWIMRKICGHSLNAIGTQIHRDHSTILSALNRLNQQMSSDKGRAERVTLLCEKADDLGNLLRFEMLSRLDPLHGATVIAFERAAPSKAGTPSESEAEGQT